MHFHSTSSILTIDCCSTEFPKRYVVNARNQGSWKFLRQSTTRSLDIISRCQANPKTWCFHESKASLKVACRKWGVSKAIGGWGVVRINYPRPCDVSCWNPTPPVDFFFSTARFKAWNPCRQDFGPLGRIPRREQTNFDTKFVGTGLSLSRSNLELWTKLE